MSRLEPTALTEIRARYARHICEKAGVTSCDLEEAFASVAREDFVGPGPWKLMDPSDPDAGYQETEDEDPRHLYQSVLVALDASRGLNNGEPVSLARFIDLLRLRRGDRVAHIGCGVGYYTAIIASIVGSSGEVVGVEYDPHLAKRAKDCLRTNHNVEVYCGDGSRAEIGTCEAIFVNAGATTPVPWLGSLSREGRMLVPLTVDVPSLGVGSGHYLRITSKSPYYEAQFVSPVMVYHCAGARSEDEMLQLKKAYEAGGEDHVRSVRLDSHRPGEACWLHGAGFCLSRVPILGAA